MILVVGGKTGTGAQIVADLKMAKYEVVAPTIDDLDVKFVWRIDDYLRDGIDETLTHVVYCAGVNFPASIGELHRDDVRNTFDVNAIGFINLLDALARWHGKENSLSVVAIVSEASHTPMRGSIAYASSKAALAQAVRCAARELAPNWRVNGVNPSVIDDTPMTNFVNKIIEKQRGWNTEEALKYELEKVPMGRRVTKAEVSQVVMSVLLGPEFMTGSLVNITGGKS